MTVAFKHKISFIVAPTGYGKTSLVHEYFKKSQYQYIWLTGRITEAKSWSILCQKFCQLEPAYEEVLSGSRHPGSKKELLHLIHQINQIKPDDTPCYIILDNVPMKDWIRNTGLLSLLQEELYNFHLHFVFLVQHIDSPAVKDEIMNCKSGCVSKEDFTIRPDEISELCQTYGVDLSQEELDTVWEISRGWPQIIMLLILAYESKNELEAEEAISQFLKIHVWKPVSERDRLFLMNMSLFESFTFTQAVRQTQVSQQEALAILDGNSCFDYNSKTHIYSMHPLIRSYSSHLLWEQSESDQKQIMRRAALICEETSQYFHAIQLYYKAGDYDHIYQMKVRMTDIYPYIKHGNRSLFLKLANRFWTSNKNGNYQFSIIMTFSLFIYNERTSMKNMVAALQTEILADTSLSQSEREAYLAELKFVTVYLRYNNLPEMHQIFKELYDNIRTPLHLIAGMFPITFGSPSILSQFYTVPGHLREQLACLEDCMPDYYRITNGHGKGMEALMKAEMLYHQGEFDGAAILCHKTIYMAESRDQYSLTVCATYLLAKLALCRGLADEFKTYKKKLPTIYQALEDSETNITLVDTHVPDTTVSDSDRFKNLLHTDSYPYLDQLKRLTQICEGDLYVTLNEPQRVSSWLTNSKALEDNVSLICLSSANIVYGKYLLLTKQYHQFLGISGQFLGLTRVYNNIMPRIYIYIYLAIANQETDSEAKAVKFLQEAIDLASADNIYMPFVENFEMIEDIFLQINMTKDNSIYYKKLKKIARSCQKGYHTVLKAERYLADFGLTKREADVARLAAKRLTNKEIAAHLFIAESTVKSNMKVIFNKLQISSRSELIKFFD